MVYTEAHWEHIVQGDMYNATETWQIGVRVRVVDPASSPTQADADNLNATFLAHWNAMFLCNLFRWTGSKTTHVGADGLIYPGSVSRFHNNPAPIAGTQNGALATHFPSQCAHVVTLTTSEPRGLAAFGRVYLPPECSILGADGRIAQAIAAPLATEVAGWLSDINNLGFVNAVAVMSKKGLGTTHNVTGTRVGRVVDTQRRRRRSLEEPPYSTGVVNP